MNLSPTRDSLLDRVSFRRTFRFVPTGTLTVVGVGAGFGVVRRTARRTGLRRVVRLVCVLVVPPATGIVSWPTAANDTDSKAITTNNASTNFRENSNAENAFRPPSRKIFEHVKLHDPS